jgi:hypothetical protein
MVVAVVAVLVAAGAVLVALRALDQANDARDIALRGGPQNVAGPAADTPPAAAAPTTDPAEVPPTTDPGAADPAAADPPATDPDATDVVPTLDPQAVYAVKYANEELRIKTVCNARYVDLDEPQVDPPTGVGDVGLAGACSVSDGIAFRFAEGARASEVSTAATTPNACVDRLRLSPVGEGAAVAIKQGVVLCVQTPRDQARERGDRMQMVILEVTNVASDKTVTLKASAWRIPI